LQAAKEA
jgi:hypothetical protein